MKAVGWTELKELAQHLRHRKTKCGIKDSGKAATGDDFMAQKGKERWEVGAMLNLKGIISLDIYTTSAMPP